MAATRAGENTTLRRQLLAWFDGHKRDLPWRRTNDPYAIWISEIMLQQTQVATVIPYFERFMRRFPGVVALAAAPMADVLGLWAGLGYYARARNMHRAAQVVVEQFGGRFPRTVEELRTLPGVGQYTAGAIASIAFGVRAAVVDGNVARVLARLFDVPDDVSLLKTKDRLWQLAESLLPAKRCGDFNEALMELGATVCLPAAATKCEICPLKLLCMAQRNGTVAVRPVKGGRPTVRRETHVVVAVRKGGKYLFVRRPDRGLWGGLWELPSAVVNGQSERALARELMQRSIDSRRIRKTPAQVRESGRNGGGKTFTTTPFCTLEHVLTHRRIRMIGYLFSATPVARAAAGSSRRWIALKDANKLGLSRAMQRVVDALRDHGRAG